MENKNPIFLNFSNSKYVARLAEHCIGIDDTSFARGVHIRGQQ